MTRRWLLIPILLTALVYGPGLVGAQFVTDDWTLLAHHQHPGDLLGEWTRSTHGHAAGLDGFVWRPLVATLHQIVGQTFGRSPLPFRLLNLLLHGGVIALIVTLLRRDGAPWRSASLVAAAWAAWPPLVDAVAWASDTYDVAAALFGLGALWAAEQPRGRLAGVFALVLAACLSKEPAAALALAVPLFVGLRRGWPEAIVPGVAAVLAVGVHAVLHRQVTGFSPPPPGLPALWTWADMAGWPLLLGIDDGFLHVGVPTGLTLSAGLGIVLVLVAGAFRSTRAAAATWAVMLVPAAAGAAAIGQEAWRYAYLPAAVAVAGLGAARLPRPWIGPLAAIVLCMAWGPRAWLRAEAWRDEPSIAEAELAVAPENPLAMQIAGRLRVAHGDASGFDLWEQAIARAPDNLFLMDPQRQRLDLAVAAWKVEDAARARKALDAFLAEEEAAGHEISPDVQRLDAVIRAGTEASPSSRKGVLPSAP